MANELDHPRNVYVREDQILGPLDGWLAQVFDPGQLDTTLDALEAAASSTDDAGQAKAQAARRRLSECDTRLARYRAALEAGTDPAVVSAWIAEVQAERLAAEVELERAAGQRSRRMSRDQLAALVNGLGNLLGVLASAAPEDKAEVYRRLGLRLTYDPGRRVVTVESHLGPDGSRELSGGRRPGGGSGPGASSADPVGESQYRRGDTHPRSTHCCRGKPLVGALQAGIGAGLGPAESDPVSVVFDWEARIPCWSLVGGILMLEGALGLAKGPRGLCPDRG